MTFKVAAGSTVCRSNKEIGLRLVIEVICPGCGANVSPGCLKALNAKIKDGHIDGLGLITPCCHMVVAMDNDFSLWIDYQSALHERQPEVTNPFNEKGMVCDVSGGVETVGDKN